MRVNYFLVGTAFLIAPCVVLFTSHAFISSWPLILLAFLLIITGLAISIMFVNSNYLNDLIIRQITSYIIDLENGKITNIQFINYRHYKITQPNFREKGAFWRDIRNAILHAGKATHPQDKENGRTSGLALLLPFGFAVYGMTQPSSSHCVLVQCNPLKTPYLQHLPGRLFLQKRQSLPLAWR
jgi:hypothetical protein